MIIERKQIAKNVCLTKIPCYQFKTNVIAVYFKRPLCREEVTANSLIPYVLKSGTRSWQTETKISKHLQELYGTGLGVSVSKTGEMQILGFKLSFAAESFLGENILEDVISFLGEIILQPYLEDGVFCKNYVNIEKEVLKESILAKINDKAYYAKERCIEIMCKNEPYGIAEEGYLEDLELLTEENLYVQYKKMISSSSVDILLEGQMDFEKAEQFIQKHISLPEGEKVEIKEENIFVEPSELKEESETMDIEQGKLVIGYRTGRNARMDDYYDLLLYSIVLGVGAQSKLFRIVREKNSLCYSIGASLERLKGLMFIQTGIESKNKNRVIELIGEQLVEMKKGNITEEELLLAKKMAINSYRSTKDSVSGLCDFYYAQGLYGKNLTIEQAIEKIEWITAEDLKKTADSIIVDTIFFLKGTEEDHFEQ